MGDFMKLTSPTLGRLASYRCIETSKGGGPGRGRSYSDGNGKPRGYPSNVSGPMLGEPAPSSEPEWPCRGQLCSPQPASTRVPNSKAMISTADIILIRDDASQSKPRDAS